MQRGPSDASAWHFRHRDLKRPWLCMKLRMTKQRALTSNMPLTLAKEIVPVSFQSHFVFEARRSVARHGDILQPSAS